MSYGIHIVIKEPKQSKLNFNNYINKFVHTTDGDILGTVESIDKDYVVVKKELIHPIYYYIPSNRFKQLDKHALWLDMSEKQATQNHLSSTNDNKINIETTTFRLNESSINNVRIEAENRMISMNTLIIQILKRFVEWDKFEPISGMIHIPKPVISEIFNKKSDKEIVDLAESIGKNAICNTILFMRGTRDIDTFLSWVETEMNNHSLNVRHMIEGDSHKYIIKHGLGYKFSLYYKTIIESVFKDQLEGKITFIISDELILFDFKF